MGYYVIKKSKTGTGLSMAQTLLGQQYYFVLKASNGEIIATSEMYNSKQAAKDGIKSVQSNGSSTDIRDET